jgi:hypothetical protein
MDFDHVALARGVFIRWNKDLAAAVVAWRRLFQNNCTYDQFEKLVYADRHTAFCQGQCKQLCQP